MMKKTILTFGLLAGLVVSGLMLATITMFKPGDLGDKGMWYGYATMIIAFSMVFAGIKNYRDKYSHGYVSFGNAIKIGLLITLIASTVYVITWEFYYNFFMPDFMDKYTAIMLDKLKTSGASAAEITKQTAAMDQYKAMYKNPFISILFTYMEILPVGIVISLISAVILKRKPGLNIAE